MNKKVIVVGEMHQDLYYENDFYNQVVEKIVERLVNFIRYNPDDLVNRNLLKKIAASGLSETPKKINGKGYIKRGGDGNNTSEYLANLDIPVQLISVIGRRSEWMINELTAKNIDTSHIHQINETTPINSIIKSDFTTKIHIATNLKERMNFKNVNLDLSQMESSDLLFITPLADKYKEILDKARNHEMIVAANIEYQKIQQLSELQEILEGKIDLIFINLGDARLITDKSGKVEQVDKVFKDFARIRVYTNGKEGSHILTDTAESIYIPTKEVKVIDRTGAGDCYAAGFLAKVHTLIGTKKRLLNLYTEENSEKLHKLLEQCGEFGTYTAIFKISHQEAPEKKELEQFIRDFEGI